MVDTYLKEDIDDLLVQHHDLLQQFKNKTLFITGATGLIGSQLVHLFIEANQCLELNMTLVALVRSLDKAKGKFADCFEQVDWLVGDINQPLVYDKQVDYIIHGASVTASKAFVDYPVDTLLTVVNGTNHVLRFALDKKVKGFVYLSSMEVYGQVAYEDISETDIGFIDFTAVRSSYSEGKRLAECLCQAYASQYHLPVTIARLTQTFGPGVDYTDNRVFAQFARAVIEEQNIVLHTTGETMRNYCYTKDALSALLYLLTQGQTGEAYNIANESSFISIYDLAHVVARLNQKGTTHVQLDLQNISKMGYNPTVKIKLQTKKLEQLGWRATVDLEEMFSRLIGSMVLQKNEG